MIRTVLILLILFLCLISEMDAQCVMCKATAESSVAEGKGTVEGLNSGILYLMGIPYFLLFTIGFILFRKQITDKLKTFKKA